MSSEEVFLGLGLTVVLAVACQVAAARLRAPAIVLLLPAGFLAGALFDDLDPTRTLGPAFSPLVSLAVAVILFDGGLELDLSELEGHSQRVVRRLLTLGIPLTWGGAALLAWPLLHLSGQSAVMLGAILIVSGPTVVGPVLEVARPTRRVKLILGWEGTTIDPVGAVIGALVFQAIQNGVKLGPGKELSAFLVCLAVGLVGGVIGTGVLWLLLTRSQLVGVLGTEVTLATVIGVAALCNVVRDDTGLLAAILMGVAMANLPGVDLPEDRPFFRTIVQLVIGILFISISATVSADSVTDVVVPSLALVGGLVLVIRPLVALVSTVRTSLTRKERIFIGWMDPRGIVAASTAATFTAPLVAAEVLGAEKLLPVTFLVIMATVTLYGLTALPVVRWLGLEENPPGERQVGLVDEPEGPPPPSDI